MTYWFKIKSKLIKSLISLNYLKHDISLQLLDRNSSRVFAQILFMLVKDLISYFEFANFNSSNHTLRFFIRILFTRIPSLKKAKKQITTKESCSALYAIEPKNSFYKGFFSFKLVLCYLNQFLNTMLYVRIGQKLT